MFGRYHVRVSELLSGRVVVKWLITAGRTCSPVIVVCSGTGTLATIPLASKNNADIMVLGT